MPIYQQPVLIPGNRLPDKNMTLLQAIDFVKNIMNAEGFYDRDKVGARWVNL